MSSSSPLPSDLIRIPAAAKILDMSPSGLKARIRRGFINVYHPPSRAKAATTFNYVSTADVLALKGTWLPVRRRMGRPTITATPTECAYLAGLIDGEGSITVCRGTMRSGRKAHHVSLAVSNCDPAMLEWIKDRFGGRVSWVTTRKGWRDSGQWRTASSAAYDVLLLVRDYLITKKAQSALAIEFSEHIYAFAGGQYRHMTDEEVEWRDGIREKMQALNRRGL